MAGFLCVVLCRGMRLFVTGAPAYARPDRVEWILKRHRHHHGDFTLLDAGGDGPAADARAFCERAGWPVETIGRDFVTREGGANYILAFGNADQAVLSLARRNGITVGEVP